MKPVKISALVAIAALFLNLGARAADPDPAAMAGQLDELKKSQDELRKDIEEIKKRLTALTTPPPRPPIAEKTDAVVSIGDIKFKGQSNAPLTIIEFSDYQCPFCARHVAQTMPQLLKNYVDAGKVRYVFRDMPIESIHPQATKAAEAARCAGDQDKYWDMHDKLFANQRALQPENLREYAKAIGANEAEFDKCLANGKHAKAVARDVEQAGTLGIRGTPTLVVGRSDGDKVKDAVLIRGAHPIAVFVAEIDKLLSGNTQAKN
jgi:protein-disulfide isomerase